jgi:uncharacterized membrane protein YfcA
MQIYLPIAEMAVPAESIFLVSALVGFLSGVFGIGGGFLTTPFLIFTGLPPAVAVGTQLLQIVASGMSAMLRHLRKGHVDLKMGSVMLAGSTAGSLVGIGIFKLLEYTGQIDFAISLLYVILLGTIGTLMLTESLFSQFFKRKSVRSEFNSFKVSSFITRLPMKMRFPRSKLYISALVPGAVGFVCGVLSAVLGIGAGFMIVPAMIYIIGMPVLVVAGTSLFQIVFMTALATILHSVASQTVDAILAVIMVFGGVIGAQIGVSFTNVIKESHARIILATLILVVCMQLSGGLFLRPDEIFSTVIK